ncbi:MAG: hypothetical protein O7C59_05400 [Rickettsia endosymbiont of Ixodes persulcatus]|nr:hypothetical protein [Rickettsia endosymbiont of Ixodes persulcatus]
MVIENAIYVREPSYIGLRQPLLIACSGGGGHIAAIHGLFQYLQQHCETINFPKYSPVLSIKGPPSPTQIKLETAINFMHAPLIGPAVQAVVSTTPYPKLPNRISFNKEIDSLNHSEKEKNKRYYRDMLLDVYPAGYASVAIWNILQRDGQVEDLKKLVYLQAKSDKENYPIVKSYILNELKNAVDSKIPYTEMVSTQAMALPALCDAVLEYNKWLEKNRLPYPKIVIHQYMTDLPTEGAVHFLNPLANLSIEQQKQIKLYAVNLQENFLKRFFFQGYHFTGVYNVPTDQNPMVRAGFKDPRLDNSNRFHLDTEITLKCHEENITEKRFVIKANESIATIMLGSQAGNDTTEYIETLLESGFDKVFVFGKNETITNKVIQIKTKYADKEIICLGNQGDKGIASLMTRSNLVIIRGGGLSVMEQLTMNHNPGQAILIHHTNADTDKELTSGIPWEDGNVDRLIKVLNEKNIYAKKTSPEQAKRQIPEARLLTALKILNPRGDHTELEMFITMMPKNAFKLFLNLLNSAYIKKNNQKIQLFLTVYTKMSRKTHVAHFRHKWLAALKVALQEKENIFEKKLEKFYMPLRNESFFNTEYLRSILIDICDHIESLQKQDIENYQYMKATVLPLILAGIYSKNPDILKQNVNTAGELAGNNKLSNLLKQLNSQIFFKADIDQIIIQLSCIPIPQQILFFSSLMEANFPEISPKKIFTIDKTCHIDSVYLEIKQKIKNYSRERKLSLDNIIKLNRKVTSRKISIANNLISNLEKLTPSKNCEEEHKLATNLTKLLLTTQTKNKETIKNNAASEGLFGEILENALQFLMIKYPSAYQKGKKEFLTGLTKILEKEVKKSFLPFQGVKRLIRFLISKIIGKSKPNPASNEPNSPIRKIDTKINSIVTVTNVNKTAPLNPTDSKTWKRQTSAMNDVNSRHSFLQIPDDDKAKSQKPKFKPWQSYCRLRR